MDNLLKPNKHDVAVCKDVRERGNPYIVAPGRLVARIGDEVIFRNHSDVPMVIKFPNGNTPFDEDEITIAINDIGRLTVAVGTPPGGYPYHIYCGGASESARGSLPIIIIIHD